METKPTLEKSVQGIETQDELSKFDTRISKTVNGTTYTFPYTESEIATFINQIKNKFDTLTLENQDTYSQVTSRFLRHPFPVQPRTNTLAFISIANRHSTEDEIKSISLDDPRCNSPAIDAQFKLNYKEQIEILRFLKKICPLVIETSSTETTSEFFPKIEEMD